LPQETGGTNWRPKLIVVAASANPNTTGSVPRIGFRISKGLHDVAGATLVLHARDRQEVAGSFPPDSVHFAGSNRLARVIRKVATTLFSEQWNLISLLDFFDYLVFDAHAYLIVRRLVWQGVADYVLRVNPVSYRFPSLLPRLPVPVFTGPHNGGMEWPGGFAYLEGKERTGQRLRFLGNMAHAVLRDTGRYAGIFVAHDMCARTVAEQHRDRVVIFPENGVDEVTFASPHAGDATRLLYVGRLTPFKAVDIAIRALARLPEQVRFTIVGDGPQQAELEGLARRLGVRDRCRFEGQQPHALLDGYYREAGVFVFPSVRESGGAVVLEAMSHSLPCLVANWGGPPIYTEKTGVHLSVQSPEALEDDLVAKLLEFLKKPEAARDIGRRSRQVIRGEYLWDSKAARLWTMIRQFAPDQRNASADRAVRISETGPRSTCNRRLR